MANVLNSSYDPIFFAQEAIAVLYDSLGTAARVYRGYDRTPQSIGSVISIPKPSTFTAQTAPGSTAQDLNTGEVQISLDQWQEVKFALTDRQLALGSEFLVQHHIRPAAEALSLAIDTGLASLWNLIPHHVGIDTGGTAPHMLPSHLNQASRVMFDNKVPQNDGELYCMLNGLMRQDLLDSDNFVQWQGAGPQGVQTQQTTALGPKYGFNLFANQNVQTTSNAGTQNTAAALTSDGAHLAGVSTIVVNGLDVNARVEVGEIIEVAATGDRYVVTAAIALASATAQSVAISPALKADLADTDAITYHPDTFGDQGLAFHRNAFALAMAPLSTLGAQVGGAKMETVVDERNQLAIRSTLAYDNDNSQVVVKLDALWGVQVLNEALAVRLAYTDHP